MKLQPNFSYQAYQATGDEKRDVDGEKKQFYYMMSTEHVQVANAVNSTIDDESFFLRERQTSFIWVNNKPIFTQTYATEAWTMAGTINTIPLDIKGDFTIINIVSCISNGSLSSSSTLLLPNLDVAVAANEISITRTGTNIVITSGGTNYSAYAGYVTVYYVKN